MHINFIRTFAYPHIKNMGLFDFFKKKESTLQEQEALDTGLEKTKDNFFSKITKVVAGKSSVDDDVLDDLEEVLVTSDVGVKTTLKIIERIQARVARDKYVSTSELNSLLKDEIQKSDQLLEKTLLVAHLFWLLMAHYRCAITSTPLVTNTNGAPLVRH